MIVLLFGQGGQVGLELKKSCPSSISLISKSSIDVNFTSLDDISDCIYQSKPDFIINAAAFTDVEKAEADPDQVFQVNSLAPETIAMHAKNLNIPLLHISTDFVFDGSGNKPWLPKDKANPANIYGKSKADGERRIIQSGCKYCVLRTSWIFSEHNKNFLKTVINISKTNKSISVVNDQIGGPTSARSIAGACYKIIDSYSKNKFVSGIFHFTGYPDVSWAAFAKAIFSLMRSDTRVKEISSAEFKSVARRPKNAQLNCDSLYSTYNIKRSSWKLDLVEVIKALNKNEN